MTMNNLPQLGPGELEPAVDLVTVFHQKTGQEMKLQLSALAGNPPSGVSGAIQFSNGSAFASDAANLFWDDTNNRLGIGTNSPNTTLEVKTANTGDVDFVNFTNGDGINTARFKANGAFILGASSDFNLLPGTATLTRFGASFGFLSAPSATVHIKGSGSTSATTSLLVQNSAGTTLMSIADNGNISFPSNTLTTFSGTVRNLSGPFESLSFQSGNSPFNFGTVSVYSITGTTPVVTSGQRDGFLGQFTFAPTSGTAILNVINASPTINQTGGANGITRGLYINPTLTAAADFRAIETSAGKIIFGGLPTSSAGLVSGQIWNDAGTIKIV